MDEAVFLHPPVPGGFNVKAPGGGKKYKGGATPIGADFRKKGGEERTTSLCCEKVQVSNQLSRGQNDVSTNS